MNRDRNDVSVGPVGSEFAEVEGVETGQIPGEEEESSAWSIVGL